MRNAAGDLPFSPQGPPSRQTQKRQILSLRDSAHTVVAIRSLLLRAGTADCRTWLVAHRFAMTALGLPTDAPPRGGPGPSRAGAAAFAAPAGKACGGESAPLPEAPAGPGRRRLPPRPGATGGSGPSPPPRPAPRTAYRAPGRRRRASRQGSRPQESAVPCTPPIKMKTLR